MENEAEESFAVIGAGSWGTALAILLARNGRRVQLWGRETGQIKEMQAQHRNPFFLPDVPFPELLEPCPDLSTALAASRNVVVAVPSVGFRPTLEQLKPCFQQDARLIWATKGFEPGSGKLLHQVVDEVFKNRISSAVLSGPSFAHEVALGLPTAVTVASADQIFSEDLAACLHNECFRVYTTDDVSGVEVGGAVKNVLAIAAGIADGLGFGANARAALITRGLAEITRLGIAFGGQRETFMGLSGLGDLVLTCTDNQSRNRRLGLALGQGEQLASALTAIQQVVEGVQTAREVVQLARTKGIDMPISMQVYQVLYKGRTPKEAVSTLFAREQKPEVI
jgi:glycerol-3-phosphate dehydrogenase (NAD(P)+)